MIAKVLEAISNLLTALLIVQVSILVNDKQLWIPKFCSYHS